MIIFLTILFTFLEFLQYAACYLLKWIDINGFWTRELMDLTIKRKRFNLIQDLLNKKNSLIRRSQDQVETKNI